MEPRAILVLIRTEVTQNQNRNDGDSKLLCFERLLSSVAITPMEDDVVRFDLTGTSPYRWTEAFIFYGNNPDRRCWCTQVQKRFLAYAMLGKIYPQRIKLCYQTTLSPPLLYTNLLAS